MKVPESGAEVSNNGTISNKLDDSTLECPKQTNKQTNKQTSIVARN
jgi:hypothetical protein